MVSLILLTKDAITACVFEESNLYAIIEEDSEFDKSTLNQVVNLKNRSAIYLILRPILYTQNTEFNEQLCIELHSPPPEKLA